MHPTCTQFAGRQLSAVAYVLCCSGTSRFCCLKRSCKHKCRIKPHSPGQAKQVSASWAASLPHPAMDTGCIFLRWCWDHRVLLHVSLVTIVPHQGLSPGNSVSCRIYFPRWVEVVNRHFQTGKSRFAQKKKPGGRKKWQLRYHQISADGAPTTGD